MDMLGFTVLSGLAAGALWGWYFATEKANERLAFWREQAARLQGENEGLIKALAEAEAAKLAAQAAPKRVRKTKEGEP
jgi:hypothetical protein